MAEVRVVSGQEKQVWVNKFLTEYIRESGILPYMGRSATSVIQIMSQLETEGGKFINIPLVGRLKGSGVIGAEVLEGNEEDMATSTDQIVINWLRNAVKIPKSSSYVTDLDLMDAAKDRLRGWDAEKLRDQVIEALLSIIIPGSSATIGNNADTAVAYASSTSSQRNTYLVANADRILFGVAKSNSSSGLWGASMGNVDAVNDTMSTQMVSLAKRMAKNADPRIRPYRTETGREFYVLFCNSLVMRDLKSDSAMQQANRDARERNVDTNPIFQDGDLIWDGVIIHEVPEMPVITGAGAMNIDVALSVLCGQQAVGVAYGQQPNIIPDQLQDYRFRPAVAIEELRGQKKLSFNGVQYGVVTLVTAATGDA